MRKDRGICQEAGQGQGRASEVLEVVEVIRQGWAWEGGEARLASFLVISTRLQGLVCPTECRIF